MSKYTTSRIPKHVNYILRSYVYACGRIDEPVSFDIGRNLARDTSYSKYFHAKKVLKDNQFSNADFPPVMRRLLTPLFKDSLKIGDVEVKKTKDLLAKRSEMDSTIITSDKARKVSNFTSYQAQIFQSFASFFSPYRTVESAFSKSYRWYIRLLNQTPIIFILKQRNRLYSEPSLHQLNYPYTQLQDIIDKHVSEKWETTDDARSIRNYHLTNLSTSDIFSLALKTNTLYSGEKVFDQVFKSIDWDKVASHEDPLEDALFQEKDIQITRDGESLPFDLLESEKICIEKACGLANLSMSSEDVQSFFPYDINYNDFSILTIENPVLNEDHTELFEALEKLGLDIMGVRVSLQSHEINHYFSSKISDSKANTSTYSTYENMLDLAKRKGSENMRGIEAIMKRLGELGFIEVKEKPHNCIYLFRSG